MGDEFIKAGLIAYLVEIKIPRREYDLIEFYKLISKDVNIFEVEFDIENHAIVFKGIKRPEK